MRTLSWLLACFLLIEARTASGQHLLTNQLSNAGPQQPARPRWDVGVTAGFFQANPRQGDDPYGDDWYFQGRYGVSIGRFWTTHLKTEAELSTTGEGTRYTHRFANIPSVPAHYPIGVQEHFRLRQVSGRVVWQFFENRWVHPYVLGGVTFDAERQHSVVPEQFFYAGGDARTPPTRIPLSLAVDAGPDTVYRAGAIAGVGTKLYVTPMAYFNTGLVMTQAKPSRTVSFTVGLGWDF